MDHRLLLKFNDDELAHRYDLGNNKVVLDSDNYYYSGGEDSGFDLYVAEDYIFEWGETKLVDYKISCEMLRSTNDGKTYLPTAYYLYPRSSIYKSNLLMVNNVGIIDKGYRGNIKSPIKWTGDNNTKWNETFVLKAGTRICQICSPDLTPFDTHVVNILSDSKRGDGGFGSTGK